MPPLPAVPSVAMVQSTYTLPDTNKSAFVKLHYKWDTGTAQGADMVDLATNVHNQWKTLFATSNFSTATQLVSTTAVDLSSSSGATGQFTATQNGGGSGEADASACGLVVWHIARRYRGSKAKSFLSGLAAGALANSTQISTTWQGNLLSTATGFLSGTGPIITATYPNISGLHLVQVSYFSGFTNYTTSSGRESSRPTLRSSPLVDIITSAKVPFAIASQRRRLKV